MNDKPKQDVDGQLNPKPNPSFDIPGVPQKPREAFDIDGVPQKPNPAFDVSGDDK